MATRRRSSRVAAAAQSTPEASTKQPASANSKQKTAPNSTTQASADDERCPACNPDDGLPQPADADKESWVQCDKCKVWFHWRCVGEGGDLDSLDKWFCQTCLAADPTRTITHKPPARKSSRRRTANDYAAMHTGEGSDPTRWTKMLEGKDIKADDFPRMNGADLSLEWLESDGQALRSPLVIESPDGLGMKVPNPELTVSDVAEMVGENTSLEVIDVATHKSAPWLLSKWAEYCATEPDKRDKVRNVISLEVSGTPLADQIMAPRIVREIDWVDKFWPTKGKTKHHPYPKVQLYCLMGSAGAWTDFHIDFAGSSVWYHVLRGEKVFYFISPTAANLQAYERWSGSELQNSWLGNMVDVVRKIELRAGNTMIIPTGWIHAVYTPVDSMVFGGNFVHSYDVPTELKVRAIEMATHVPKKFTYPLFTKLCWYAGEKYLRDLRSKEEFSNRVLESIDALANFLVSEVRAMERGTDSAKKEAKEQVPGDRVKDAASVARELRWRVAAALGISSDDEERRAVRKVKAGSIAPNKRKREGSESGSDVVRPRFKNFTPAGWERVTETRGETASSHETRARPGAEHGWEEPWAEWKNELDEQNTGESVEVNRRTDVVIKVRRTTFGLERQRIERVWEEWAWGEKTPNGEVKEES